MKRNAKPEPLGIFTTTSCRAVQSQDPSPASVISAITIRDGVGVDLPSDFKALLNGCPRETLFILEWLRKIAMDFALPRLSADSKVSLPLQTMHEI